MVCVVGKKGEGVDVTLVVFKAMDVGKLLANVARKHEIFSTVIWQSNLMHNSIRFYFKYVIGSPLLRCQYTVHSVQEIYRSSFVLNEVASLSFAKLPIIFDTLPHKNRIFRILRSLNEFNYGKSEGQKTLK